MAQSKPTFYEHYFNFTTFSSFPELFLGYSILLLSLYSVTISYLNITAPPTEKRYFSTPNYSFPGFFIFSLSALLLTNEESLQHLGFFNIFSMSLINDQLAFLTKTAICLTVAIFFLSLQFTQSGISLSNSFEYFAFVATSALGSIILCSAGDLLTAYLAIELQSISFYLMASSKKNSNYSTESGLKYFIIGSFSSAFFLLGSSYIYVTFGTINFVELKVLSSLWFHALSIGHELNQSLINAAFVLLCISLLIKLAVAPFHLWSIDVYESSPTPTTYFFAVVPKLGLFVLLIRIFYSGNFLLFSAGFSYYCLLFALLSIFVGALGGIEQRKLKSLLAYSSVGHTGYVLLAFSTGVSLSIPLMIQYLILYMLSSLCFWAAFSFLKQKNQTYNQKFNKELGDLLLLTKANPALAFVFAGTLFSLAGIPPLLGFLLKFGAFFTAIQASAYVSSIVGILLTLISTFYYLRMIKILFFENSGVGKLYYPVTSGKAIIISTLSLLLLVLFIKPNLMYLIVLKAYLFIF